VDWCCWDFGLGGQKSNFLELGSRRGSVPSWLGGKSFRQAVSRKQFAALQQPSSSRGNLQLLLFYPKFNLWHL
jgi:hypothetical protein